MVTGNIGGVYEYYKTYDQNGAVYTHVAAEKQKEALDFLQDNLFTTPNWMIDQNIFNKVQPAGSVERIRGMQVRTLNSILDFGRIARMIENEALNNDDAYPYLSMMQELRQGLFSELRSGKTIDVYRRNLQRAYIDRMEFLMTEDQPRLRGAFARFSRRTNVNVSQSDIRPVVRAELKNLRRNVQAAIGRTRDQMSRYHLSDLAERIDLILDPK